jgi:pimeloyl-ACP methyl ester carboxylesterase
MEIHGDKNKETVVFVHGLGDEASSIWKSSVEKLKTHYRVIVFDLPGFGKSSKSSAEYTPEKYAFVLNHIISQYVQTPFYLVGHSMGGAISLKYTTLFGNNVKKLFLIASAGVLHQDAYGQFLIKMGVDKFINTKQSDALNTKITNFITNVSNELNRIVAKDLYSIVRTEYLRKSIFQENPIPIAAVGLVTETLFDIPKIKVPTLILWGENDDITPLRTGYVLNELIENSQLEIINNSGHVPILDSKERYLSYLEQFLNEDIHKKESILQASSTQEAQIVQEMGSKIDCNFKSLKIINSKNIQLYNCHLEELVIENSTVWLTDSNIVSKDIALSVYNSTLNITSTNIKARIAIKTYHSKLDLAAVKLTASESSILSEGINEVIFSLSTVENPLTNKILHKKIIMKDNNKL